MRAPQENQPKEISRRQLLKVAGIGSLAFVGYALYKLPLIGRAGSYSIPAGTTPTPSEATGTPTPEWANPIKIESAKAAATRFGGTPEDWEINQYGGAHFKDHAKVVRLKTDGVVVEGWIKSEMEGARDALTFVSDTNVPFVELNGGTFWDFGGNEAGFAQVLGQVKDKEAKEQPDVLVVPLCGDLKPIDTVDVTVNKVISASDAARRFGIEGTYSGKASSWEINEWGGAHLKETNAASLVNLNGAVLEGWVRANREDGRNAITFVTHPNVLQMRTNGGTLWNFADSNRGFQQLLDQVLSKEKVEQPDVTVLPAYDCAVTQ